MTEIVLYHHAQGQTVGFLAFAEWLRAAGHTVHTPDLYDGRAFKALDDGVAHAEAVGFDALIARGAAAAASLPASVVYAGFSLGVLPAEKLALTRPGARGALFFHGAAPLASFNAPWPAGVPLQIHTMEEDDWGDVDVARELAATIVGAELFLYPGRAHLFADSSLPAYDERAATLLRERVLAFLARVG